MPDEQEMSDYFALWNLESAIHSPEWPLFKTHDAVEKVKERALAIIGTGMVSISAFIIAFNQLRSEGEIDQVRQPRLPEIEETALTAEQYHSLPSAVLQRRFKNDPEFRAGVDALIQKGLI